MANEKVARGDNVDELVVSLIDLNVSSSIVFVNTVRKCKNACKEIFKEKIIALDLEGIDLGRTGEICLLQIGCEDGRVYLFDIFVLKHNAFTKNNLKKILESKFITKIIFDCRSDCDALKYQYDISTQKLFDLQILYVKVKCPKARFLPGMKRVLEDTISPEDKDRIGTIKTEGVNLYAPEKGGNYDVWKERPLNPKLLEYSAEDVKQLFLIYFRWKDSDGRVTGQVYGATSARIRNTINREVPIPSGLFPSPMAERDFY